MNIEKLKDILLAAVDVVESRQGDVYTEDGSVATVSIDEVIWLENALCEFFETETDDATRSEIGPKIDVLVFD